jgi:hypothetical protein
MFGRLTVGLLLLASCGSDSSTTDAAPGQGDGPIDGAVDDFGCAGGSACLQTDVCCAMPGHTPAFACTATASCPAPDQLNCDGPMDCSGSTPVCCGTDVPNGTGTFPTCGVTSVGTSCSTAAACPTHVATNCTDTTKVQLCKVPADCTDATNNKCCTFASNGASLTFCIDATTAQLGGGVCH